MGIKNIQYFLNDVNRSIKNKEYSFYPGEKSPLLEQLIEVIGKGTKHQKERAVLLMKKIGEIPYKTNSD